MQTNILALQYNDWSMLRKSTRVLNSFLLVWKYEGFVNKTVVGPEMKLN